MDQNMTDQHKAAPETQLYPELSCHVAAEAAFKLAVAAGIASFEVGPTLDHQTIEAELRLLATAKA